MRLLKMKDSKDARSERHPLESVASEGMVWRWMPYSPGGPPLHSPGEFSVPIDQGEVDAILDAAEHGRAVPVFTQQSTKVTKKSTDFLAKKDRSHRAFQSSTAFLLLRACLPFGKFERLEDEGNAFFKAGDFVKACSAQSAQLDSEFRFSWDSSKASRP
ncbi:unnamed protein product [Durusdinium trenchii]|uniref:Uncharacterized protein n=1 Tax=Durusdinium trenchii TaxID=1381693 RepID=A0ABP0LLN1_9DINO